MAQLNSFKIESTIKDVVKTWLNRHYMVGCYGPLTWEMTEQGCMEA